MYTKTNPNLIKAQTKTFCSQWAFFTHHSESPVVDLKTYTRKEIQILYIQRVTHKASRTAPALGSPAHGKRTVGKHFSGLETFSRIKT